MPSLKDAACEMDGRVVAIDVRSRAVTPLATEFEGKSFQMPNDLVLDRVGDRPSAPEAVSRDQATDRITTLRSGAIYGVGQRDAPTGSYWQ